MALRVLVCDDDEFLRHAVRAHLEGRGDEVLDAVDGADLVAAVEKHAPDVVLLDLHMPRTDGLVAMAELMKDEGAPPVVVMTAYAQLGSAVEATRLGAAAYLTKPLNFDEVFLQLDRAVSRRRLDDDMARLRERDRRGYGQMIAKAPAMRPVIERLRRLEEVRSPTVLISGESGTGKDLVAQALHAEGLRRDEPFMAVDCTALPEHLMESLLFGHEKGAFTDARQTKAGMFEAAGAGTVFLDELGELPLGLQSKLLRVLESRTFKRVGGVRSMPFEAAVVAATNRNLEAEVAAGRFREDLFYRLNVVPIAVPPLRERTEDIPLLVEHFLTEFHRQLGTGFHGASEPALGVLKNYPWPGNVRELRNVLERVAILDPSESVLQASQLPPEIRFFEGETRAVAAPADEHAPPAEAPPPADAPAFVLPEAGVDLEELERDLLLQALKRTGGQRTQAAALLGITRHALRYRLGKLGLEV